LVAGSAIWFGLIVLWAVALGQMPQTGALDGLTLRTVLLAPLPEEVLLRGLLLSYLVRREVRLTLAILLTSFGFLLLHLPGWAYMGGLGGRLQLAGSIVLLGIFLGIVTGRTGSVWPAYAVHVLNNGFSTGLIRALVGV
jgi:membrane protease YdiL (CAAX protease family)